MAQIIYCSNQVREETGLLPTIDDKNERLIERTFEGIYHTFESRTIENQLSFYTGENGKERLYLKEIIERMNKILQWAGNDSSITVWNEMIELTPYNYISKEGNQCSIRIFDEYIKRIYNSKEQRFQVASNIRFNNINRNALLILTICTRSYTDGMPLNISGNDIGIKAMELQSIIKECNNKKKPNCTTKCSNQYAYDNYPISNGQQSAIKFE